MSRNLTKAKAEIIDDINRMLVKWGKEPLSPKDFDILYDMDIDELLNAQHEISKQLDLQLTTV